MQITRRYPNGKAAEILAEGTDGTKSVLRITGVVLQRTYKVDSRPWYDVPVCDWPKFSPDELRAIACLIDGLAYGEEFDCEPVL